MRRVALTVLVSVGVVILSALIVYLSWAVHLALDRVCVRHARRFCRKRGLEVSRARGQIEFERRADGGRGFKTEFTLVQLDCRDGQQQRRLVTLRVWPLGVRKLISDEVYPESYDQQWPRERA